MQFKKFTGDGCNCDRTINSTVSNKTCACKHLNVIGIHSKKYSLIKI